MAALVVLGLAAGVAGVAGVQERAGLVEGVAARSGPLAVAVQDLYRALSDADATAASAFLTGGLEPAGLRERYQTDIGQAAAALTAAAAGIGAGPGADAVAVLSGGLPVYAGLVETARAYNRQGLPLGAAYLREASGLMRERLLPAAESLYRVVSGGLDRARGRAAAFPWLAVALGVLVLGALVAAQVWLFRRTNRVLNLGLAVAALASLASTLWLMLSWSGSVEHLEAGRRDGSVQVDLIAGARIAALKARGDEALTLVARGTGARFEEDYRAQLTALVGQDGSGGSLAQTRRQATDATARSAADDAIAAATQWRSVHIRLRDLDSGGRYTEAVAIAIGTGPDSAGSAFGRLDAELAEGIAHASARFDREAARAAAALSGVDIWIALLTALVLTGAVVGVQRRMAEYR